MNKAFYSQQIDLERLIGRCSRHDDCGPTICESQVRQKVFCLSLPPWKTINRQQHFNGVYSMTSSITSKPAPSLAQPTTDAIQQPITAPSPSGLAPAITAQVAGAPVQRSTMGAAPAMTFSSRSGAASPAAASLARPTVQRGGKQAAASPG